MSTGSFCWFDLMTTDVPRARAFYAALFGWDVRDHNPEYSMIHDRNGRALGGMMSAQGGQPSAWLPYVTVDDITAAVAAIQANGGRLFMQHQAPGVGKFAIYADPQGAVLAVIQLENETPYPREKGENHIGWAELQSPDPASAYTFHHAIFGWAKQEWGPDYLLVGSEHAGGIIRGQPGVPPHWLIYVNTQDADATAARVGELGGSVLMAPQEMGDVGRFGVFADPAGGVFAVMQSRERG